MFTTLKAELDNDNAVFSTVESAFRDAEKRLGGPLTFPLFSLFWDTVSRDETMANQAAARDGRFLKRFSTLQTGTRVRLIPVSLEYTLGLWYNRESDLIDAIKTVFFFSSRAGGNGATVTFRDLPQGVYESADKPAREALDGFSFDLTIDPTAAIEKSQGNSTNEVGAYYHAAMAITAHTWMAKGIDIPLIRKLVVNIYSVDSSTPGVITPNTLTRTIERDASF